MRDLRCVFFVTKLIWLEVLQADFKGQSERYYYINDEQVDLSPSKMLTEMVEVDALQLQLDQSQLIDEVVEDCDNNEIGSLHGDVYPFWVILLHCDKIIQGVPKQDDYADEVNEYSKPCLRVNVRSVLNEQVDREWTIDRKDDQAEDQTLDVAAEIFLFLNGMIKEEDHDWKIL